MMDAALCPKCRKVWEVPPDPQKLLSHIICTCGEKFKIAPNIVSLREALMPRTPLGPGVESYVAHTCNCDADPADKSFFKSESHSETCPAKLGLLRPEPNLMRALEALKNLPEDQPLPTPSTSPDIADLVVEDLKARKLVGISRYGRALQAHNGRDAMRDAYEEALDLCNYLRQMLYERDGK